MKKLAEVKKAIAGAAAAVVTLQAAEGNVIPRTWLGAAGAVIAAAAAFLAVYFPKNQ